MFDFVTKNFAMVSALLSAFAVCIAITFLFAYLSVFDPDLIWIIEYPDIIKFWLIGLALLSGVVAIYSNVVENVSRYFINKDKLARTFFIAVISVNILVLAWNIYFDIKSKTPTFELDIYVFTTFIFIIVYIYYFSRLYEEYTQTTKVGFSRVVLALVLTILFVANLGRTYGLSVRDRVTGAQHDVSMKLEGNFRRTFADAKIILITSHHTILSAADAIFVVESADITQITTHSRARNL